MSTDPTANPQDENKDAGEAESAQRNLDAQNKLDATKDETADYGTDQMRYMSDLEHVRERSGMYIGNRDATGLHHLVSEVVDNSIDEVMGGHATVIQVTVNPDGSITVADDGRGIPVEVDPNIGKSALEGVMTMLKYGGKFDNKAYKTSAGLHGMGVKAVNFLSEWCEVEVRRGGHAFQQEYERGKPTSAVIRVGTAQGTGTKTTFKPDYQMFGDLKFDYNTLYKRLQELAFLNRGVKIAFKDLRNGEGETFQYKDGIVEFIRYLNRASEAIHQDVVYIHSQSDDTTVDVEVAFQYCTEYTENVHSYANNVNTVYGGTHVIGFRTALTRTLNAYGKKENIFKDIVPTGEDLREGLTAIISVRLPNPQFEAQTKGKLNNTEMEGIVNSVAGEYLAKYLEEHPKTAKSMIAKAVLAAEAREAARKAKALLRERKGALAGGGLPGKLRDCTSKVVDRCELYLVEGDSAGGSAEGGRDREFQAILPLRGKIINAYKSREDKVLANEEVRSIISAVGSGIGDEVDLTKRRYGKVIIMTDADVDGSHIRTLLLTFFYRQMYDLVRGKHVYVAQPPLFKITHKKQTHYVQTEVEMNAMLLESGLKDAVFEPGDGRRIEGAEMEKLCRTLAALEDSLVALERRGVSLRAHAARQDMNTGRLPMYHVFVGHGEHWFATREALDEFLAKQEQESGAELKLSDESAAARPATSMATRWQEGEEENGPAPPHRLHIVEFHEIRSRIPTAYLAEKLRKAGPEDRKPDPAGADGRRGAEQACSAAAKPRSASTISAAS